MFEIYEDPYSNTTTNRLITIEPFGFACYVVADGWAKHVGVVGTWSKATRWADGDDSIALLKVYDDDGKVKRA